MWSTKGESVSTTKRQFGAIERLPRGATVPSTADPTCDVTPLRTPSTLDRRRGLAHRQRRRISREEWSPPTRLRDAPQAETVGTYAEKWLRRRDLKPRTREHYRSILDRQILPTFAGVPLKAVTSESVRDWYADLEPRHPTVRSHAYSLLRDHLSPQLSSTRRSHRAHATSVAQARQGAPARFGPPPCQSSRPSPRQCPRGTGRCCCCAPGAACARGGDRAAPQGPGPQQRLIHVRRGVAHAGVKVVGTPKSDAGDETSPSRPT